MPDDPRGLIIEDIAERVASRLVPREDAAAAHVVERIAAAVAHRLKGNGIDFRQLARDWRPRILYAEGTLCCHKGGLWQAFCETSAEPGAPGEWTLLAEGVRNVYATHEPRDPRAFAIHIGLSSGQRDFSLKFRLPVPLHQGPYQPSITSSATRCISSAPPIAPSKTRRGGRRRAGA